MSTVERITTLQHAVGFYVSRAHLIAQVTSLVGAALDRGEPAVLAVTPDVEAEVRNALGRSAGLFSMAHPDGPPGRSGQTLVAVRARELRRVVGRHGSATLVSEHRSTFDGPDGRFWTELDAAANIALADLALKLTCFFPERPENPGVLAGARRNHALLLVDDELRDNPDHRDPQAVLAEIPVPPLPDLRPPDVQRTFESRQLHELRALVEIALRKADITEERAEDVALAVNEVATNAVQHGGVDARFLMWSEPGELVFEVHDRGVLDDVLPGLCPPHRARPFQRGLWIARQLCDCLHIWTDDDGTHVRIHATA